MLRSLFISFNLIIVMIIKLIADGPTATIKAPSSVKAGESFLVEVTIKTNGEKDFMRYSMQLPAGWTADVVSTDGGDHIADPKNVKILWQSVNGKTELKISYRINVPADTIGEITFPCKLSHPLNNHNENIDLDPLKITVKAGTAATTTYNNTHSIPDSTAKPPAEVSVERIVPTDPVSGNFLVSLNIHKEDLNSFGKIEDTLPSGFTAKMVKADGGQFKFENGVVTFGWYAGMPKKSTLYVEYKVFVSPDMTGNQTISGRISYNENEKGKVVNIPTSIVTIKSNNAIVQNSKVDTSSHAANNTTTADNTTKTTSTDNSNNTTTSDNSTAKTTSTDNSNSSTTADNTDKTNSTDNSNSSTSADNTSKTASTDNSNSSTTSDNSTAKTNSTDNTSGNSVADAGSALTSNSNSSQNSNSTSSNTTNNTSSQNLTASTTSTTNPDTSSSSVATQSNVKSAGSVVFSVQLAAMVRLLPVSYYNSTFNISETIKMELDNGLNKYITGTFSSYQEARDKRNQMRGKGVSDAFVTAYNAGKRITVQEALMITNQKWIL